MQNNLSQQLQLQQLQEKPETEAKKVFFDFKLKEIQGDKKELFSRIYDEFVEKIYRFIFFKVNSEQLAEDLTAETFLRFWKYLAADKKIDKIGALLYRIAINLVIDFYRRKAHQEVLVDEYFDQIDKNFDIKEKLELDDKIGQVYQVMKDLRQNYREVIIWYYLEELTISEISEILEKKESTVRVLIHRALHALRAKL